MILLLLRQQCQAGLRIYCADRKKIQACIPVHDFRNWEYFIMRQIRSFLNTNIMVISIRQGLLLTIPFLLVGSFSLAFLNFPLASWQRWLAEAEGLRLLLLGLYETTMGSLALFFVLMISYSYGEKQNVLQNTRIFFPAVSLGSFIAFCAPSGGSDIWGAEWIFTALCITLVCCHMITRLYHLIYGHQSLYTIGVAYNFNASMQSMVPAAVTITFFGVLGISLYYLFHDVNIINFGSFLFMKLFSHMGNSLSSMLLYIAISHMLWFFGIHGSNTLDAVSTRLFEPDILLNQAMAAAGQVPEHIYSKTFLDTFIFMGGSGSSLCLILALFLAARNKHNRRLAAMSLVPVGFNINELLLFGFPIIFSTDMILPFIITPMVLAVISSGAMSLGLVPVAFQSVDWTVPPVLNGYLATGSLRGSLLQLLNLAVGTLIYLPFVRRSEANQKAEFLRQIDQLKHSMEETDPALWTRNFTWDSYDNQQTAKVLSADLRFAMAKDKLELYYQPQMRDDGSLYGCEALLRWNYEEQLFISPPLIIVLAAQSGFIHELGLYILRRACRDMAKVKAAAGRTILFSVNVLPLQLEEPAFADRVIRILKEENIPGRQLTIELTEQVALVPSASLDRQLLKLKEYGIRLSMDDFGMGHGSLSYLNSGHYDEVKIDGALIRLLPSHSQTCELVGNIMNMARILRLDTVAECVESQEQVQSLQSLGCTIYQGYYYSRPLAPEDFISYVKGLSCHSWQD